MRVRPLTDKHLHPRQVRAIRVDEGDRAEAALRRTASEESSIGSGFAADCTLNGRLPSDGPVLNEEVI